MTGAARTARVRRRGLTLIEMLFGFVMFTILAVAVGRNIRFATLAGRLQDKLDVLQRLRLAELQLRRRLQAGTAVLHPPPDGDPPRGALVFTGPLNELQAVYLTPGGELRMRTQRVDPADLSRRVTETEVLARKIRAFEVSQPLPGQVQCRIQADSEADAASGHPERGKLEVVFSGYVGNQFYGEGRAP